MADTRETVPLAPSSESLPVEPTDDGRSRPLPMLAALGKPVDNPPPVIEPTGAVQRLVGVRPRRLEALPAEPTEAGAAERFLGVGRRGRPVRRTFLVPTTARIAAARDQSGQEEEPERQRRNRARHRTGTPTAARPPSGQRDLPASAHDEDEHREARPLRVSPALPQRRTAHKLAAVGAGVCAALLLVVGGSVATGAMRLGTITASVRAMLSAPAAVPLAGPPPSDPAQRVAYYQPAAKAGNAEAQLQLAVLYAKGEGVAGQDYGAAARWFRAAANQGVVRAQYDLAVLYERGRGVPANMAEAVAWYRKAATNNYPLAQYNLAVAYTKGQGVHQDFFEAALWYHRAAAQGIVPAMVNLAILYERGQGVDASKADAYAWYRAADQRGSAPARQRADELLAEFSAWDQTRAEMMTENVAASIREPAPERRPGAAEAASTSGPTTSPMLKPGVGPGSLSTPAGGSDADEP